ncbi:unnamed protein product [Prorocentrum cordatum]|uniref:Apple domain-containing protein n=1 Tax=Prorocentrum cordatum TaxID=2364126 RepID=A0ABN9UE84_9DINO|nr:unnamed protein product [Polarella glacialis]
MPDATAARVSPALVNLAILAQATLAADLILHGGAGGWDESAWSVQVDGVMGGKSSGELRFQDGRLVFSGIIDLNGGGFSSVRAGMEPSDLSTYDGLVVELDAAAYVPSRAPLGVHLQLRHASSFWSFAAAFAVPFADEAGASARVFLPLADFDRGSGMGYTCSVCSLDTTRIVGVDVYVLFQEGPFEVRLRSITAVQQAQRFSSPPISLLSSGAVQDFLESAVESGASLYNKGYTELCIAVYASCLSSLGVSTGPSDGVKGVACAGLKASGQGSKSQRAFALRSTIDAILADLQGAPRDSSLSWLPSSNAASAALDTCQANFSVDVSSNFLLEGPSSTVSGAVDGFEGPFSGMGISGYNDLGKHMVGSPAECAGLCLDMATCSSFDYGARGDVEGECWLSTADRISAGSAYTYGYITITMRWCQLWMRCRRLAVARELAVRTVLTALRPRRPLAPCASAVSLLQWFFGSFSKCFHMRHTDGLIVSFGWEGRWWQICTLAS